MANAVVLVKWSILSEEEKQQFCEIFDVFEASADDIDYIAYVPQADKEEYELLFAEGTPFGVCCVKEFGPIMLDDVKYVVLVGYHA